MSREQTMDPEVIRPSAGAQPPAGPPPGNFVASPEGEGGGEQVITSAPTHVIWREWGPEYVHPDGYSPEVLEPLPEGFCAETMRGDPATRTFAPDLATIRAAKWGEVKALRDELENGVAQLPEPLGPIQTDDRSKIKINGLVTRALVAAAAENALPPNSSPLFLEDFTRADNRVVTLTSVLVAKMGEGVARHVSTVFATSRALREQIFAEDATAESVLAIDVTAAFAAALESIS